MEDTSKQHLNPWFSMWTQPRATIQQIIDDDPEHMVLLLAALAGFVQALEMTTVNTGSSYDWLFRLLLIVIAGPIGGIIWLYINSALIHWTGEGSGGQASTEDIRAAIAWAFIPILWTSLFLQPLLALFGGQQPSPEGNPSTPILVGLGLIQNIAEVWAFVVFLKSLAQVQRFSVWDALCNSFKALFVIGIAGMVLYKLIFSIFL
ncbi:MAG: Yip1 family protein [Candidatus Electrothrix communis]|nr:MAG: Yip1 family protein [Candidatus Electrothrix communis]